MAITATQVSALRQQTNCGMMDCKKALEEAKGDLELASEILRKKGILKAEKKAGRVASEGVIKIALNQDQTQGIMLEINSETDFVARDSNFLEFAEKALQIALKNKATTIGALGELSYDDSQSLEQARAALIAKIGENINLRRLVFVSSEGHLGAYIHGGRIGVIVDMHGGDEECAKDMAMHIAASHPLVVSSEQVSADVIKKEREIYTEQILATGKSPDIVGKIVEGKIKKYLSEISLEGQAFVKNPDITVGQLLKEKKASVKQFYRFELGEGIEKKSEDFAEEVMAQVKGS